MKMSLHINDYIIKNITHYLQHYPEFITAYDLWNFIILKKIYIYLFLNSNIASSKRALSWNWNIPSTLKSNKELLAELEFSRFYSRARVLEEYEFYAKFTLHYFAVAIPSYSCLGNMNGIQNPRNRIKIYSTSEIESGG